MANYRHQPPQTDIRRTDAIEDTVNTRPATRDEVAYRDGYTKGRAYEQYLRQESRRNTERDGIATGILFGVLLTSVIGIGVILLQIFAQNREPLTVVRPLSGSILEAVPAGVSSTTTIAPAPAPQVIERTTIIERDVAPETAPLPAPPQGTLNPGGNPTQPNTSQPSAGQSNPAPFQGQGSFNSNPGNDVQPSPLSPDASGGQTAPNSTTSGTQTTPNNTTPSGTQTNPGGSGTVQGGQD